MKASSLHSVYEFPVLYYGYRILAVLFTAKGFFAFLYQAESFENHATELGDMHSIPSEEVTDRDKWKVLVSGSGKYAPHGTLFPWVCEPEHSQHSGVGSEVREVGM